MSTQVGWVFGRFLHPYALASLFPVPCSLPSPQNLFSRPYLDNHDMKRNTLLIVIEIIVIGGILFGWIAPLLFPSEEQEQSIRLVGTLGHRSRIRVSLGESLIFRCHPHEKPGFS